MPCAPLLFGVPGGSSLSVSGDMCLVLGGFIVLTAWTVLLGGSELCWGPKPKSLRTWLGGCLGGSTRSGGVVTDGVVTNGVDVAGSRMVGACWW